MIEKESIRLPTRKAHITGTIQDMEASGLLGTLFSFRLGYEQTDSIARDPHDPTYVHPAPSDDLETVETYYSFVAPRSGLYNFGFQYEIADDENDVPVILLRFAEQIKQHMACLPVQPKHAIILDTELDRFPLITVAVMMSFGDA